MPDSEDKIKLSDLIGDRFAVIGGKPSKLEVISELVGMMLDVEGMASRDDLEWGVLHRESILSTGIGNGIAVPHARLDTLDGAWCSGALIPGGIPDYQTPDSQPVRLVFLIVCGGEQRALHLKILSVVGSLFFDGRLKAAFLASPEKNSCLQILHRAENI